MTMRKNASSHRSRGFTLLEALIVVVLISLLITLLVPALNTAKEMANTLACKAALRQFHGIFFSYIEDHNGDYLRAFHTYGPGDGEYWEWHTAIVYLGYIDQDTPHSMKCRTATHWRDENDVLQGNYWGDYWYAYNTMLIRKFYTKPFTHVWMADSMWRFMENSAVVIWPPSLQPITTPWKQSPTQYRHMFDQGVANYLLSDGSVTQYTWDDPAPYWAAHGDGSEGTALWTGHNEAVPP
jgi:prepilin-type N-terminal cleavage/methylation domain-containing protein